MRRVLESHFNRRQFDLVEEMGTEIIGVSVELFEFHGSEVFEYTFFELRFVFCHLIINSF